LILCRKNY